MCITIIKPGLLDTIQDLGRNGQASYGINPGGTMDRFAAKMANALAGNDETEAVLEIHFPGPQILFEKDALISLTGADFLPSVNDEIIPCWQPVFLRKNTILQFTGKKSGARAYLAVHGGFCMEKWLNSFGTHLKAGLGGYKGRKLEKGDTLIFGETVHDIHKRIRHNNNYQQLPWRPDITNVYDRPNGMYFMYGNEWKELTGQSKEELEKNTFYVSMMSDRMGYQLKGPALAAADGREMISTAVSYGTIQLPPNGQLIVLMADHQTTGGYPRIGHVITAHLPKLAQLCAGDAVSFTPVKISDAEEILFSQHKNLAIMQRACLDRLNSYI